MKCRHCATESTVLFVDLATAPPSNAYLRFEQLARPETWYPLRVLACPRCWLVQTEDYAHHAELFADDYAYFSSFSTSWLDHCERYVAAMVDRFELDQRSLVVEVASNDGYLLQFARQRGIPCLGVEPTASTAAAARAKGIETVESFFGVALAEELVSAGRSADLMAANNVLAHVPDINDFVAGFATVLKPTGVATFEFPHLLRLVQDAQFDTVYHEHFSYLSLTAVARVFAANGLAVFDVEEVPTHGGSLRVYAQRAADGARPVDPSVGRLLQTEELAGVATEAFYAGFQHRVDAIADATLRFLVDARSEGARVAAYGAAAKGNTLFNYCGVRRGLVPWVVDRNPAKVGKFMPGSRIPIVGEERLRDERPDYVFILPWNLKAEVMRQLDYIRAWGGRFVVAIPALSIE
jgi:SAM-dependent methyltransferase